MKFDISDRNTQALLLFLLIGLVAGWLAGKLLGGGGLIRNLVVGVLGAFVGGFVVKALNLNVGIGNALHLQGSLVGLVDQIAVATLGAIVIVVVAKLIR